MALVSVIIPSFNRDIHVARAIYSVLIQQYSDYEIVVVDDGSNDYSRLVYEMFGDSIRVIYHDQNRGVSAARNTGIKGSRGQFIAFLDSDDYWLPEKLSIQVDFMRSHSSMVCQTQEYWVRNGRRVHPNRMNEKPKGDIFGSSIRRSYISPSCIMLDRAVVEDVGVFREDLLAAEDYELWLRICFKYEVGLIDRPLVVREMGMREHLSVRPEGLEYWRMLALAGFLRGHLEDQERVFMALYELREKCRIYRVGAEKRQRSLEARLLRAMEAYIDQCLKG